jgi:shikimate kinase
MDEEVIRLAGKSIEAIFAREGEGEFRKQERLVLEKLCKEKDAIVSTGGGAACFFDNIKLMNSSGITVYLDVSANELARRILGQKVQERPMFKNKPEKEVKEILSERLAQRNPFYMQSKYILTGDQIKAENIIKLIS